MSKKSKQVLLTSYPFLFLGYIVFYIILEFGIFDSAGSRILRIIGVAILFYAIIYLGVLYKRIKNGYVPDKSKPNYSQMIIYGILGLASGWIPLLFLYIYSNFKGRDIFSIIFYILWVIYFARIGYKKKREIINF